MSDNLKERAGQCHVFHVLSSYEMSSTVRSRETDWQMTTM